MIADFVLAVICLLSLFATVAAPTSGAPVCLVIAISTGFVLFELRCIQIKMTRLIALAEESPDATAAAMRRAVQPAATKEAV
jgi:hypothetical protein